MGRELLKEFLKECGLKVTETRLRILELLHEVYEPQSPSALLERFHKRNEKMDQVTIYRVLESFKSKNIVHEIHPGKRYLLCTHRSCQKSLHLVTHCMECGKASEEGVPQGILESMLQFLEEQKNFTPREHFVQIDGRCKACS